MNPVDERLVELARADIGPPTSRCAECGLLRCPTRDSWNCRTPGRSCSGSARCVRCRERDAVQLDHVLVSHSQSIFGTPYWRVPGTTGNPTGVSRARKPLSRRTKRSGRVRNPRVRRASAGGMGGTRTGSAA